MKERKDEGMESSRKERIWVRYVAMKPDGRFIVFFWHGMEWKSFYNGVYSLQAAPIYFLGGAPDPNDTEMCRSSVHKIGLRPNNCLLSFLLATLWCNCTVESFAQP
jgi:hypothetical protein